MAEELLNSEVDGSVPFHYAGMPETEPMRRQNILKEAVDMRSFESDNIHPVVSIKAAKEDVTIPLGATVQLQIVPEPFVGNIPYLVWETSDYEVIYINQDINSVPGMIEALKVGKATVTATNPLDNSQTITWNITVCGCGAGCNCESTVTDDVTVTISTPPAEEVVVETPVIEDPIPSPAKKASRKKTTEVVD